MRAKVGRAVLLALTTSLLTTGVEAETCGGELVAVRAKPGASQPTVAGLAASVGPGGALLIGERHGVRDHPKAAACLIAALATKTPPTVVMEMLSADQRETVDSYRAAHPEIVDGLGVQLAWWKTGWPAWPVYAPLFDMVWRTRSALVPGDLAKSAVMKPPAALDAAFGDKLAATRASWSAAMKTAHCGLIDDAKALSLADRQINRDLAMSAALDAAVSRGRPAVLYAGRAHIRADRSVGLLLRSADKTRAVVTVSLQETAVAGVAVDRAAVLAEASGRYDYVWFTGVADKADACDRLRAKGLIPTAGVKAREGAK